MSRKEQLERLIQNHKRRLQLLEQRQAMDGQDTPHHILIEIEEIKATITELQSVLEHEPSSSERAPRPARAKIQAAIVTDQSPEPVKNGRSRPTGCLSVLGLLNRFRSDTRVTAETGYEKSQRRGPAPGQQPERTAEDKAAIIETLRQQLRDSLANFGRTLDKLSKELDYISGQARMGAVKCLDQARQQFERVETEWKVLEPQPEPEEESLRSLLAAIPEASIGLQLLQLRHNHRRNFNLLQEHLVSQQIVLTQEQLETTLRPHVDLEQAQIEALAAKERLDEHEQTMLKIHRRNVEHYRQMLAGERPYAPLNLLNQMDGVEESLKKIDTELSRL
jgi:hypothetical protein